MALTLLCVLVSVVLMVIDTRRREGVSAASWIPVIWIALISSRPVATWFDTGFGGAAGVADSYDAGNPIDRWVYFVLILFAGIELARRKVSAAALLRGNGWLAVFVAYCAVSVLWSDSPSVGVKRWIKDVGNILMVLLVMTEAKPTEAMKAVFFRVAAVLVPFSVLFIRFIPELGRAYHPWTGEMTFTGVATHKNSLGAIMMVCIVFLVWDFLAARKDKTTRRGWIGQAADVSLIVIAIWLLLVSRSATSLLCTVVSGAVFFALKSKSIRSNIRRWWAVLIVAGGAWWILDSTLGLSQFVIVEVLNRDPTLTTRTEVWPVLIRYADTPLIGAGFNSFWSGGRLEELYALYGIFQAHNGYIETFLNGGVIGVLLLGMTLIAAVRKLNAELMTDNYDLAAIKMVVLVSAIVYNFSEATFSKMSPVWFVVLFAIVWCPLEAIVKTRPVRSFGSVASASGRSAAGLNGRLAGVDDRLIRPRQRVSAK